MTTQVQIKKIGDEFLLPLDDEMLQKLGVRNGGEVEIISSDDQIVLRRSQNGGDRRREFRKLADEMFDDYDELFTALAEGAK